MTERKWDGTAEHARVLNADKVQAGTVDMTPNWADIVGIYMGVLENPAASATALDAARSEIRRMATLADAYIATGKAITKALDTADKANAELLERIRNPRPSSEDGY